MNENTLLTTDEVKKMVDTVQQFSYRHGYMEKENYFLTVMDAEEWLDYCNEYNLEQCPEEWAGDAGHKDPSILTVPTATIRDEGETSWGVFGNAGISSAANFLVAIPSFRIPHEQRVSVVDMAIRQALK